MDEAINKNIGANPGVDVPEPASTATSALPPVSFQARFFWGIGSLGTITYLNIVTALVLVYLTSIVQLDASVAGTLVFIARIVDAFMDPGMGWVTDHTRTRWGRRRPYLLLGAIVCAASMPLVFSVHALPVIINPATTVLLCLIVYSLGFTIFNVPYLAMPVEMTTDRMQRFSVMSYRVIFMMMGALIGNAGAPWLLERLGQDADAFQQLGIIGGAIVGLAMFATFAGTHSAHATEATSVKLTFRQQVATHCRQPPFPAADRREGAAVFLPSRLLRARRRFSSPSC